MRRTGLTVLATLLWLVLTASPASAHTVSGVGATNWQTTLIGLSPAVPGLRVRVVETGSKLEVSNTGAEIVVVGYDGEPYLRVGPAGVFENLESPATYLNCSRQGCTPPTDLQPDGPPRWHQISRGHVARFHDHRIHWMGSQVPPDVRRAPGQRHERPVWHVELLQGTTTIDVSGHLTWVPGPSPLPWLLLAAAGMAVAVGAGFLPRWGRPLAALVALLTVNDVIHAVAIGFSVAAPLTTRLGRVATGSFYSIIGWVLGVAGVYLLARRRVDGLYAATFAGLSAALFTGVLDFSVLSRSTAPFNGPMWADRVTVAVSLGVGVGLAVGSLVALRRLPDVPEDLDPGPVLVVADDGGPAPGPVASGG